MKTFILILAMLAAPLAAQDKQPQNTAPPQTAVQSLSEQASQTKAPSAAQHPQTVVNPTAKPAQTHPPQQLITFAPEQLDEYENKILDRAENFYNNRMTHVLWTMGILMGIGGAIVGILIPMILEWYRKGSFEKEMSTRLKDFKKYTEEQTEKLKTELISQIDDREAKQTKGISSSFSMAFLGLGGLLSSEQSAVGYGLMLQSYVLAMKFYIIGQCSGGCITASQIIQLLTYQDKGSEITLDTLEVVDIEIENMKKDLNEIVDKEKREDMESQVRDLQIFVHALIYEKRQTAPPQAEPQQS